PPRVQWLRIRAPPWWLVVCARQHSAPYRRYRRGGGVLFGGGGGGKHRGAGGGRGRGGGGGGWGLWGGGGGGGVGGGAGGGEGEEECAGGRGLRGPRRHTKERAGLELLHQVGRIETLSSRPHIQSTCWGAACCPPGPSPFQQRVRVSGACPSRLPYESSRWY